MRGSKVLVIRPTARFVLHVVAAAVGAVAILFATAAWHLASGPISLSLLTPYLADALRQSDSPYHVEFSDTTLAWAGWERTLDIRLIDIAVVDEDGVMAATAPEISIALSVPAMLRGIIATTRLEIIQPEFRLVRDVEGNISLGFGDVAGVAGDPSELLFADLLAPPDTSRAMGYLTNLSIVNARLTFEDQRLGLSWEAPHATVSFARDDAGIAAAASIDLVIAGHVAGFTGYGRYRIDGGGYSAHIDFVEIDPHWFAEQAAEFAVLSAVRLPVSGGIDVDLDADLALTELAFDLSVGAGAVTLEGLLDDAVAVAFGHARGVLTTSPPRLRLDDAFLDVGGPTVGGKALLEGDIDTPFIAAELTIRDMPVDELGRYWPPALGADARGWIFVNLTDGVVRKAETTLHLRPEDYARERMPDEILSMALDLEGFTVNYLDPLPKIYGVDATAHMTGTAFRMTMTSGSLEGLRAVKGDLSIIGLGVEDDMTIAVTITGPVRDAIEVLAHPRLSYAQRLGISPAAISGEGTTELWIRFPLYNGLSFDDVDIKAGSSLEGVAITDAFGGYDVSEGVLSLVLDLEGMDVSGPMKLDGVPAAVTWRENFGDGAEFKRRYAMQGEFDSAQRATLGIPGNAFVIGSVDMDVEIIDFADGIRRWNASAELIDAKVKVPGIPWIKPVGTEGLLQLKIHQAPGAPLIVDEIEYAGGDMALSGRAELDPATGEMRRIDLNRLDFGETRVAVAVVPTAEGGFGISLSGPSLDLRPYFDEIDAGAAETTPPLNVTAQLDQVILNDSYTLHTVEATLRYRNDRWDGLKLSGMFSGKKQLLVSIDPSEVGRILTVTSDNAGAVLRSFGVYDNMIGGRLALRANLDGKDDAIIGELQIADFKVVKAPLLAKVLVVASLTGVFDLLKGEGLPFSTLVAPFIKRGDIVMVKEARASGLAIGLTTEGQADLAAETIDVNGTVVPAYSVNSLFANVPVLGALLVGEKGGGVFAATYRMTGPMDDPEVTVNPLAALAPGILRELFSVFDDAGNGEAEDDDGVDSTATDK